MARTAHDPAVADLIATYPPEVQEIVLATRAFAHKLIPDAVESVDPKARVIGIGFGTAYKDMICAIMPAKAWATLGIARGTQLPDPKKLLEGSGKVHRHVKVRSKSDLENPALSALLQAAIALWRQGSRDPVSRPSRRVARSRAAARG
jgi:hypothetical protein